MTTSHTTIQPPSFASSVLGKRRASQRRQHLVLHLSSDAGSSHEESDSGPQNGSASGPSSILIINGTLVHRPVRPYKCTFDGCDKSYTKPSRLEEHERSHTGSRPFVCGTCQKSYLRDSHLHAHVRSHLPESEKPFLCDFDSCHKRFWTTQHLHAHEKVHTGERPFKCPEPDCPESFAKNYQLRAHSCTVHAPPGTKPYQCTFDGCPKSFATNQKLRTHLKVHDENRYTCVHAGCLSSVNSTPTYFGTWTALQHHIRTAHPPMCPHPSCNSKTFTSHKGLRAHQKLHDEREAEAKLNEEVSESDADDSETERPLRKKRRGGELGRDWKCEVESCEKDFKSKKALTVHTRVTHLGRRDFVCPHADCGKAFGYKHLLQRHTARIHGAPVPAASSGNDSELEQPDTDAHHTDTWVDIDAITGNKYAKQATVKLKASKALRCPYPRLTTLVPSNLEDASIPPTGLNCEYIFSRAYDFRRHLRKDHGVEAEKDAVDKWVRKEKSRLETE